MKYNSKKAFSLIEIMVVMAIMSLMMTFAVVGLAGLKNESSMSEGVATITEVLRLARSYAVSNNAYSFVGVTEVNGLTDPGAVPQVSGNGRLAMVVFTTLDKSNGSSANFTQSNVMVVNPLQEMQNLHLSNGFVYSGQPAVSKIKTEDINTVQALTFQNGPMVWPLTGSVKYTFNKVIQFSSNGSAQLLNANFDSSLSIPIEFNLQPAHGNTVNANAQSTIDSAIVIVDGVNGDSTVYRP